MNLAELRANGGIVSSEKVKVHIEWKQGDDAFDGDVYIRRQSWGDIEKLWKAEEGVSQSAQFLASMVSFDEDGKEPLTYDDVLALHPSLAASLLVAAKKVNGGEEKNSVPPMNSAAT